MCSTQSVSKLKTPQHACRDSNKFSFNPYSRSCESCPSNAICDYPGKSTEVPPIGPNGAILVPKNGYWHSSPRSAQIHICPHEAACRGKVAETRVTDLVAYQKHLINNRLGDGGIRGWPVLQQDVDEYNLMQCQEGHYGESIACIRIVCTSRACTPASSLQNVSTIPLCASCIMFMLTT
jgi:hypothetical protein